MKEIKLILFLVAASSALDYQHTDPQERKLVLRYSKFFGEPRSDFVYYNQPSFQEPLDSNPEIYNPSAAGILFKPLEADASLSPETRYSGYQNVDKVVAETTYSLNKLEDKVTDNVGKIMKKIDEDIKKMQEKVMQDSRKLEGRLDEEINKFENKIRGEIPIFDDTIKRGYNSETNNGKQEDRINTEPVYNTNPSSNLKFIYEDLPDDFIGSIRDPNTQWSQIKYDSGYVHDTDLPHVNPLIKLENLLKGLVPDEERRGRTERAASYGTSAVRWNNHGIHEKESASQAGDYQQPESYSSGGRNNGYSSSGYGRSYFDNSQGSHYRPQTERGGYVSGSYNSGSFSPNPVHTVPYSSGYGRQTSYGNQRQIHDVEIEGQKEYDSRGNRGNTGFAGRPRDNNYNEQREHDSQNQDCDGQAEYTGQEQTDDVDFENKGEELVGKQQPQKQRGYTGQKQVGSTSYGQRQSYGNPARLSGNNLGSQREYGNQEPTENIHFGGQKQSHERGYGGQHQTDNVHFGSQKQTDNEEHDSQHPTDNFHYGGQKQTDDVEFGSQRQTDDFHYGGQKQTDDVDFGGQHQTDNVRFTGQQQTDDVEFGSQRQTDDFHYGGQKQTDDVEFGSQRQTDDFHHGGQKQTDDVDFGGQHQTDNVRFTGQQQTDDVEFGSQQQTNKAVFNGLHRTNGITSQHQRDRLQFGSQQQTDDVEFGGQQQTDDVKFEGQKQTDNVEFSGQRQTNVHYGGQKQTDDVEFDGQHQTDNVGFGGQHHRDNAYYGGQQQTHDIEFANQYQTDDGQLGGQKQTEDKMNYQPNIRNPALQVPSVYSGQKPINREMQGVFGTQMSYGQHKPSFSLGGARQTEKTPFRPQRQEEDDIFEGQKPNDDVQFSGQKLTDDVQFAGQEQTVDVQFAGQEQTADVQFAGQEQTDDVQFAGQEQTDDVQFAGQEQTDDVQFAGQEQIGDVQFGRERGHGYYKKPDEELQGQKSITSNRGSHSDFSGYNYNQRRGSGNGNLLQGDRTNNPNYQNREGQSSGNPNFPPSGSYSSSFQSGHTQGEGIQIPNKDQQVGSFQFNNPRTNQEGSNYMSNRNTGRQQNHEELGHQRDQFGVSTEQQKPIFETSVPLNLEHSNRRQQDHTGPSPSVSSYGYRSYSQGYRSHSYQQNGAQRSNYGSSYSRGSYNAHNYDGIPEQKVRESSIEMVETTTQKVKTYKTIESLLDELEKDLMGSHTENREDVSSEIERSRDVSINPSSNQDTESPTYIPYVPKPGPTTKNALLIPPNQQPSKLFIPYAPQPGSPIKTNSGALFNPPNKQPSQLFIPYAPQSESVIKADTGTLLSAENRQVQSPSEYIPYSPPSPPFEYISEEEEEKTSFWSNLGNKVKNTYNKAKDKTKQLMSNIQEKIA